MGRIMPSINLITPPDKLFNNNYNILLIYPSDTVKTEFQEIISNWNEDLNVYIYQLENTEHNFDWLLSTCKMCDTVIFDIDNSDVELKQLASYIVANSNTYWLTNSANPVYNILSVNRIYDLKFLCKGDNIEQQTTQNEE